MEYPRIPLDDLKTFSGRAKHLYYIQIKSGETKPFTFFDAQKRFDKIVEQEFQRTKNEIGGRQARIIAVKPRQVGWTTYSCIRSLDMQIYNEGSNGVIAAHDQDTTELIYNIFLRAYKHLPEYVVPTLDGKDLTRREYLKQVADPKKLKGVDLSGQEFNEVMMIKIKPETTSESGKRIGFKDTESITTIFTAGKGDSGGKGGTLRRCHLSECANYDSYSKLLSSINPSIPKFDDDVFMILESTANGTTGAGEGFYKAWTRAVKEWDQYRQGKRQRYSGFRPVFIPWYMFDEYELPLAGGKYENIDEVDFGDPETKQAFLDREEEVLKEGIYNPLTEKIYKITPEKLNWYRWIIKTDCEYNYRDAQRYYPITPEEAFVASSQCFFDAMKLNHIKNNYLNNGEPKYELGDLIWSHDNELEFRPSSVGNLKIYKYPEKDWTGRYVIGADISMGVEGGDYSVAYVKDRFTQEFVAIWYGRIDQDVFAEILIELGLFYNEALLAPESNLDTVVNIIKPDGITPYIGDVYYNQSGNSIKYGYWTNGSSRQIMLDYHKAWFRENGYDKIPDIDTLDEHLSFVRHITRTGVKYAADEGAHDDRVIAMGITNVADDWWEETPKEYKPSRIREIIANPNKRRQKYIRMSKLGRSKN